jgi:hypothetical protein
MTALLLALIEQGSLKFVYGSATFKIWSAEWINFGK